MTIPTATIEQLIAAMGATYDRRDRLAAIHDRTGNPETARAVSRVDAVGEHYFRQMLAAEDVELAAGRPVHTCMNGRPDLHPDPADECARCDMLIADRARVRQ